ncbi:MAG: transporter [Ignavibacteria bacterium]
MKISHLVLCLSIILNSNIFSQVDDISPDRPGAGNGSALMDQGLIQVELGGSIEKVTEFNSPIGLFKIFSHSYPSILLRYGVTGNVEVRLGAEYLQEELSNIESSNPNTTGFSPISVGTKIKLFREKGLLPETAFLFTVSVPFKKNSPFQSDYIGSEFQLAMSNTVNKRFSLTYNIGGSWGAGDPGVTGFYSLSLGANLVKKLAAFVEIYGYLPEKNSPDHRFDGGFTYMILKNLQADISGGLGISEKSPEYFVGLGISVRLPE